MIIGGHGPKHFATEIINADSEAATHALSVRAEIEAFDALYHQHYRRVMHHALSRLGQRQNAEDVTALVFQEAWRKRHIVVLSGDTAIAWLLTTANFVISNQRRSDRRYRELMEKVPRTDYVQDHSESVLAKIETETRNMFLTAALERLRPADQRILLLCLQDAMTTAQVSRILNIPEGTVKSRLSRAKLRLKESVRRGVQTDSVPDTSQETF